MTSSIRAWMTLGYVAATYHTSDAALMERLGLPSTTDPETSLKSLAEKAGVARPAYNQRVQHAIAELAPDARSDHANESSGWLGSIGDQLLTALLVYGYPVLGLTLLLCAIGLPLPDGIATTVAGSLIAQGRMDWALAGTITVAASILGDGVGYSLGRLLNQEVLERHGRWFAYTPARRARVQLLFNRWGSLTIFLTRTIMSYLAPVASLLAGVSRYRLSKFLAIALVGRIAWAATYLGLGYGIGADWLAATSFLANLSALILLLIALIVSGVIASGRFVSSLRV